MDQAEKMRDVFSKEKKLTDDVINKKTFYHQKLKERNSKQFDLI
jgi:hypothetical protein